jgi:SAM-dependent methyltransferase
LRDEQFDVVASNCVLEHVLDDQAALAGMVRSLRTGGVLFLSTDNAEHDLALRCLERAPRWVKALLLRQEFAKAPDLSRAIHARIAALWKVRRRYRLDELVTKLSTLGMAVQENQTYLSGPGAAQFEALFAVNGPDATKGIGRALYWLSSLVLFPFAVLSDRRASARGHGLALVALKGSESRRS